MAGSIKARYRKQLYGFVTLIALLVLPAYAGNTIIGSIERGAWGDLVDLKVILPLALPLITLILDGIVTPGFKDLLVFWRRPRPGSQAFTTYGKLDDRVDMEVLKERYGPLPTTPKEENQLWYKISKVMKDLASVDEAHYAWLLARDLTNLSFALAIVSAGLGIGLGVAPLWVLAVVAAQALLYIALSRVATNKAVRFVTTVLAEASTS